MINYSDYLKNLRKSGQISFTTKQLMTELKVSKDAALAAIHRMKKAGDIISPAQGFYVIIDSKYQAFGCIPDAELLPVLAKHLNLNYYVALLSAGLYHGATHQKPNSFQVITDRQMKRKFQFGDVRIQFIYKKSLENLPIQKVVVPTGYLKISSPELTTMDLLLYPERSGGLNHIATVLSELENIDSDKLLKLAELSGEQSWVQRLGYILDQIKTENSEAIINSLTQYLSNKKLQFVRLVPEIPNTNYPRNKKWMIIENTTIESDI
jgi:predicted transcriptional regulator of viral defense system